MDNKVKGRKVLFAKKQKKAKGSYSFLQLFRDAFNLSADQASYDEIQERIHSGVVLRGTNMCILILAIFIASIGLNMNSTAVIIGAMLISPLMGPIMGIGFAIATSDRGLIKNSFTVLFFEVTVALLTSTIYFSITPITSASSELLARTSPTLWDVLIAICGGLAGMIGTTRKEKSNLIPGVAIATALMPPLCTAGYGLAIGNFRYFLGAMYLFCINSIFIAITTMIITAFLRLPQKDITNKEERKHLIKKVLLIAVLTIAPSIYIASGIVKDTVFKSNVETYVEEAFQFENTQVVKYDVDEENGFLEIAVIGTILSEDEISVLKNAMKNYNINHLELRIRQTEVKTGITTAELEAYVKNETSQLTAANEKNYQDLESQLVTTKTQLAQYQEKEVDVQSLKEELGILYPMIKSIEAGYLSNEKEERLTVIITVIEVIDQVELRKINEWLTRRLEVETLNLYQCYQNVLYPMGTDVYIPDEAIQDSEAETGTDADTTSEE